MRAVVVTWEKPANTLTKNKTLIVRKRINIPPQCPPAADTPGILGVHYRIFETVA
jgi:hypothetical protein